MPSNVMCLMYLIDSVLKVIAEVFHIVSSVQKMIPLPRPPPVMRASSPLRSVGLVK